MDKSVTTKTTKKPRKKDKTKNIISDVNYTIWYKSVFEKIPQVTQANNTNVWCIYPDEWYRSDELYEIYLWWLTSITLLAFDDNMISDESYIICFRKLTQSTKPSAMNMTPRLP